MACRVLAEPGLWPSDAAECQISHQERNDRPLRVPKARILDDSVWMTASELSAEAGFRSADPEAGPKGWKAAGKIFSLKIGGANLYPDYVLDEKACPFKVVRLILSLFI